MYLYLLTEFLLSGKFITLAKTKSNIARKILCSETCSASTRRLVGDGFDTLTKPHNN